MILEQIEAPIVLAPLGGGPSTPELAAAVSEAGGLGFLAWGYLAPEQAAGAVAATRSLTDRPFGVNVFHPVPGPTDPAVYAGYVERLERWARDRGMAAGEARFSGDCFEEKIDLLTENPVAVVSFAFGCPEAKVVDRLRAAGSEVWVAVTSPDEADRAASAGADALVVQGIEAGGHRASFADSDDAPAFALLPLLQLISARQSLPLVASGGIATGGAIAAALCAGASAAQIGSAFMLCPEAGTAPAHREALQSGRATSLTRAFTGRTARGIRNPFMDEHDDHAPYAYPEIHYITAPFRRTAREAGDDSAINLWAGEAHELARELPAGQLVRELMSEAEAATAAAHAQFS